MGRKPVLEKGQKFGRLTIVEPSGKNSQGARTWLCKCDCGVSIASPTTARLRNGSTASCGCKQREAASRTGTAKRIAFGQASGTTLWWAYKAGAKKRGHEWSLTKEQFGELTKGDCYYCGAEPAQMAGSTRWSAYTYNGVDRVDNALGYEPSNCVPCCSTCNKIKGQVSRAIIERAYLKLHSRE